MSAQRDAHGQPGRSALSLPLFPSPSAGHASSLPQSKDARPRARLSPRSPSARREVPSAQYTKQTSPRTLVDSTLPDTSWYRSGHLWTVKLTGLQPGTTHSYYIDNTQQADSVIRCGLSHVPRVGLQEAYSTVELRSALHIDLLSSAQARGRALLLLLTSPQTACCILSCINAASGRDPPCRSRKWSFTTLPEVGVRTRVRIGVFGDLGQTVYSAQTLAHLSKETPQIILNMGAAL